LTLIKVCLQNELSSVFVVYLFAETQLFHVLIASEVTVGNKVGIDALHSHSYKS